MREGSMTLGRATTQDNSFDLVFELHHDYVYRLAHALAHIVLRARDMPPVDVQIEASDGEPVNGSDAVFAAVAAAAWIGEGCAQDWPTRRR